MRREAHYSKVCHSLVIWCQNCILILNSIITKFILVPSRLREILRLITPCKENQDCKRIFANYDDVIMGATASQITSPTIVYSTANSGTDQRKFTQDNSTRNFDYINCRGIDLVKRLNLYTIRERRDYFLTTLMFKAFHGIAPHYLSDRIDMHFDINGYNTREAGSMNVYRPAVHKEIYRNSFLHSGGKLWNELPDFVKNSTNIETFKRNYRIYKSLT